MAHNDEKVVLPCGQHITIMVWALGVLITAMTMMSYGIIDNRNRTVDEERVLVQELANARLINAQQHAEMMDKWGSQHQETLQRLSRIESRLDIKI